MKKYIISADSGSDLPENLCREQNITLHPVPYCFDNIIYGTDKKMSTEEFYTRIRKGETATTMAVNTEAAKELFRKSIENGCDIIHISFSSALSSTCQNACIAARELMIEYPGVRITVIDSLCASLGEGLLAYKASVYKALGHDYDDTVKYILSVRHRIAHRFTVDSLEYLRRGGRISGAACILGSIIDIKPLLHVDEEGRLTPTGKVRGRKKSIHAITDMLIKSIKSENYDNKTVAVCHSDCINDAMYAADLIRGETGIEDIIINGIGPAIASHSGPGTIAVFYETGTR